MISTQKCCSDLPTIYIVRRMLSDLNVELSGIFNRDFVLMLTEDTSLLALLYTEYDTCTLYVHAEPTTLLITSTAFLCAPRYACRDVWKKLVCLFAGMEAFS